MAISRLQTNTAQYPLLFASASGGNATDTYTGDGVNTGVSGYVYRYHRFTSSGTFTVSTAGMMDMFLIAAGGSGGTGTGSWAAGGGGAGGAVDGSFWFEAGTYTITIPGIQTNGTGADAFLFGPTARSAANRMTIYVPGGGVGGSNNSAGAAGGNAGSGATASYSGYFGENGNSTGGGIGLLGTGAGRTVYYTGAGVTYGVGGVGPGRTFRDTPPANSGSGGSNASTYDGPYPGAAGCCIIRYRIG